jgi:NTE family protein
VTILSGMRTYTVSVLASLILLGCHSYGQVKNQATDQLITDGVYSLRAQTQAEAESGRSPEIKFVLSFSGGGTRAAAMAYGVMEELRDNNILIDGQPSRLLDEIDFISSVSGGSFTAAYYGLHGEQMFDVFEDEFLRFNLQSKLTKSVLNPFHWFGPKGRTEHSIEIYDKYLFHNATMADMAKPGRPMVVINASDLSHGVRFSFIQDYFNLLCSDISSFPVSRAVTASSAVPIVFNPVVLENFSGCPDLIAEQREQIEKRMQGDAELTALYEGLRTYSDKETRKYIHFVDGGITDNMGLRAMSDVIQFGGGLKTYLQKKGEALPGAVVLISVNASTSPQTEMDATNKQPSIAKSIGAMSSVQLTRYNVATLELVKGELESWAEELSTPEHQVTAYFIEVSFEDIEQPQLKLFLNKVPTSFSLTDEQVDKLTNSARALLRKDPVFQKLLSDFGQP